MESVETRRSISKFLQPKEVSESELALVPVLETKAQSDDSSELVHLDQLLEKGESIAWEIGDFLAELIDQRGFKLADIAKRYLRADGSCPSGRSKPRLSQFYSNAKEFPPGRRRTDILFDQHEVIRISAKRVEKAAKSSGEKFVVKKEKYLKLIGKSIKTGRGLSRAITKMMSCDAREELEKRQACRNAQKLEQLPPEKKSIIDACHNVDYVKILEKMEDGSIDLIHLDPPYGQFMKTRDGKYDMSSSASSFTDCANETEIEAIKTTIAGIQIAEKKLKPNGVIALWQSGRYLRPQIASAIEAAGLLIWMPLIWEKSPQPGDMNTPITISSEFCYIISRKDAVLENMAVNHPEYSSRKQIWDFPVVKHNAAEVSLQKQTHAFEKPRQWNELLIHKFCAENGIVFDGFGASGSMCEACIELNRRFVYCEFHPNNFRLGQCRIEATRKRLERQTKSA